MLARLTAPLLALILLGIAVPASAAKAIVMPPELRLAAAEVLDHVAMLVDDTPAGLSGDTLAQWHAVQKLVGEPWAQELIAAWAATIDEKPDLDLSPSKAHAYGKTPDPTYTAVALNFSKAGLDGRPDDQAAGFLALTEALEALSQAKGMSFNAKLLQLQVNMQSESRQFTMISNIMKTKHDTVKNSISNVR
ncbi:MAG: hypothetical protein ABI743_13105 [bacterium]